MPLAMRRFATCAIAAAALIGCASRPPTPHAEPLADAFILERDLAGKTVGAGSFTTITGADRDFTAHLDGTWDGATLTLVEDFVYDDGETDRKTWRLTRQDDGEWTGLREDVVGTARGYQDGEAFRLEYNVRLGDRVVGFRDVLVRRADGSVLNEARVGWRGVNVGKVTLEIRRAE